MIGSGLVGFQVSTRPYLVAHQVVRRSEGVFPAHTCDHGARVLTKRKVLNNMKVVT